MFRQSRNADHGVADERGGSMRVMPGKRRTQASGKNASRAERELQETIDTIPTLISSYSPDGKRIFINPAWQRYTGLSKSDVLGSDSTTIVHPDDVDIAEAKCRDALVTGETLHIEERIWRADGECRWHLVERVPLRDENGNILRWYASSYDIDDRRRAESALQVSQTQLVNAERELRLTLDSIPILAWRTRPDRFCEYANTLAGLHRPFPGASLGVGWQTVIHPEDHTQLLSDRQEILASGKSAEAEARMRRFDGEYRWFLFWPAPLYD